jgi:nitrite reductase (NO-forming)
MLNVSGEEEIAVYSHKIKDEIYLGSGSTGNTDPTLGPVEGNSTASNNNGFSKDAGVQKISDIGKNIFATTCTPCHQANGEGIPNVFPPLAKSDYLKNKDAAITAVVKGLSGPLTVNGKNFNGVMPAQTLNDEQIAAVLTYVYSQWGNSGLKVSKEEVSKIRGKKVVASK